MADASPLPFPRLGLIGCGYVSKYHLASARTLGVPILATCDTRVEAAEAVAAKTGASVFATARELFDRGGCDGVIIATPHLHHAPIAVAALEAGLHVLIEKPLSVSAADADRVREASAGRPSLACGVNFNHRAWPLWVEIKRLLDAGELGKVRRYQWTITEWYRTQHYYDSSPWRGTWDGEGGGLLVNQCPHELDLLCWFFGTPDNVIADVRLGKHHRIEVEDEVHAIIAYADGMTGSFIASTGEPCGVNRLEIVGDRGILRVTADDAFEWTRFAVDAPTQTAQSASRGDPPPYTTETIRVGDHDDEYIRVFANFVAACRGEGPVLASAADASQSVQLANAILLSGTTGGRVALPVSSGDYDAGMDALRCSGKHATSRTARTN